MGSIDDKRWCLAGFSRRLRTANFSSFTTSVNTVYNVIINQPSFFFFSQLELKLSLSYAVSRRLRTKTRYEIRC